MSNVSSEWGRGQGFLCRVAQLPHNNWLCGHPDSTRNHDSVSIVTSFISFMEIYNNLEKAMMAMAV